ncbi:MAG: hypothetical protein ACYS74_08675 [Planctomycetota bacterium]
MDEDFFELQMELLREQFGEAGLPQWDDNARASRIMQASTEEETSEFNDDLRAQMLEIQMAVEQVRAEPLTPPNPEPHDIDVTLPQDSFEQREEMLESQLREFEPAESDYGAGIEAVFDAQEALFDLPELEAEFMSQPTAGMGPLASPGPESLEQIVEAHDIADGVPDTPDYDDSLMTPDHFEQEMGEAAEPMEWMEPYPDPFGHYGGMMPQEMYDEQAPEMMDPYMTPDMIDPYMMPGPFGPGPMLDPGPGGPP